MIEVITYNYGVNTKRNNKHNSITKSWDSVQRSVSYTLLLESFKGKDNLLNLVVFMTS
jgi:hypothetical protein